MAAFIRFRSTCFSEHLKVDALFIKQPNYFFSQYFYFKNCPKKYVLSFTLPWGEGIPSLLFIMFSSLLFAPTLFKNFSLLAKSKDFDFFKATLSTLNITYIKPIYIKSSFGFHSNNGTTVLKLKTISISRSYWRIWFCKTVYTGLTSEGVDITRRSMILLLVFAFSVY